MKKLTSTELSNLWGYSGIGSIGVLSNGQNGYFYNKDTNETTIVMCCSNCGDYSRVTFTGKINK